MELATGMNQLFRNLCNHTMWNYSILWKFQHENHMFVTCKESYAINIKSGTAMEYSSHDEFASCHCWRSSVQNENTPVCSIVVAVSNMMQISYSLGEGIVGKVASMENHLWICVDEMISDLLLEFPEEIGHQVAAGIKTILFLPVFPLGLVQLGSLEKVSEDLAMVAELKDLFYSYQYTSVLGLRMEQTNSSTTSNMPSLEKYSACFDQVTVNELLPIGSETLPNKVPQSSGKLIDDSLHLVHGLDADIFDEISWSAMCSELFGDHSDEQVMLNTSTFIGRTIESVQTSFITENEIKMIPVNGHRLTSKNTMFDPYDFNKAHHTFVEEFDLISKSKANSEHTDFFVDTGPHKAMEHCCSVGCKDNECIDTKSKTHEGNKLISIFKEKMPEGFGFPDKGAGFITNENGSEYVSSIPNDKELKSCAFAKSCYTSAGRCADSCLTHCKADDVSNSEDSGLNSYKLSSLIPDPEGFKVYPTTYQSTSPFHITPNYAEKMDKANGFWSNCLNDSHVSHKETKNKYPGKPRPRDRQLIQDRIKELRELIPNSSKCSVDALLQRTVNHMMFLQSIPIHAIKLSQTTRPKVADKDLSFQSTQVPQTGAHWAHDAANTLVKFPLVIENLDQPNQMLVEMQCGNHKLFLEIAQAIKRLGLTILKGILEIRSEQLWAHFIVEIPKGFHRTDIIWPLLQLLQIKL